MICEGWSTDIRTPRRKNKNQYDQWNAYMMTLSLYSIITDSMEPFHGKFWKETYWWRTENVACKLRYRHEDLMLDTFNQR